MIKVNLVPKELLDKETQKLRKLQLAAGAIFIVVVISLATAGHFIRQARLEHRVTQLQGDYDTLAKVVAQVEEADKMANAVKNRLGVIKGLLKGRSLYPYFMTDLVATMPPGVWLTGLTTTSKEGTNQLGVQTVAASTSSEAIAEWLRKLDSSGKFDESKLSAITMSDSGGGARSGAFSISMTYKNPEL